MGGAITVRNLNKSFREKEVFRDLDFCVRPGKITAVIGPNGCGKSTLFNILTGVLEQDGGGCQIAEPDNFDVSYVAQNYRDTLLPWRKNYQNLALPLQIRKISKKEIREQIDHLFKVYDFGIDLDVFPYQLSGGQQQLLSYIRAIVTKPKVLLLDEPFSALDYENNIRLRDKLQKYHQQTKSTIFIITHNIEEAVYLAEEIIMLSGTPTRVVDVIKNPLPYPRTIDTMQTVEFNNVKKQTIGVFKELARL